jgi:hypothetical protein
MTPQHRTTLTLILLLIELLAQRLQSAEAATLTTLTDRTRRALSTPAPADVAQLCEAAAIYLSNLDPTSAIHVLLPLFAVHELQVWAGAQANTPNDTGMESGSWSARGVTCLYCGHTWIAIHPADADPLECPRCHIQPTPAPEIQA